MRCMRWSQKGKFYKQEILPKHLLLKRLTPYFDKNFIKYVCTNNSIILSSPLYVKIREEKSHCLSKIRRGLKTFIRWQKLVGCVLCKNYYRIPCSTALPEIFGCMWDEESSNISWFLISGSCLSQYFTHSWFRRFPLENSTEILEMNFTSKPRPILKYNWKDKFIYKTHYAW